MVYGFDKLSAERIARAVYAFERTQQMQVGMQPRRIHQPAFVAPGSIYNIATLSANDSINLDLNDYIDTSGAYALMIEMRLEMDCYVDVVDYQQSELNINYDYELGQEQVTRSINVIPSIGYQHLPVYDDVITGGQHTGHTAGDGTHQHGVSIETASPGMLYYANFCQACIDYPKDGMLTISTDSTAANAYVDFLVSLVFKK